MPFEEICSKPARRDVTRTAKRLSELSILEDKMHMKGHVDPGGGYSWEFLVGGGGVPPGSPNPDPISDLRLERKQTNSSNAFRIRIFLFFSYSFGIETINTFIHSCSSPENHTLFQTKMDKVYTRFQSKTAQNPYPMGRHIPI